MTRAEDALGRQRQIGRALRRARLAIYLGVVLVVAYHVWRYDLTQLPAGGVSPLEDVPPGSRLVVDLFPRALVAGDAVLYRDSGGQLLLGRVSAPPDSAPASVLDACERGALWVRKDRPEVPGADSLLLGPLERSAIVGRIALALPW